MHFLIFFAIKNKDTVMLMNTDMIFKGIQIQEFCQCS